jgi:hypothetical protein
MVILTEAETQAIIEAAIRGSGPLNEGQLQGIVDWARLVKVQMSLFNLICEGEVLINLTGPEPQFRMAEGRGC